MVEAYLLVDHGYENFEKRSIASIQVKKKKTHQVPNYLGKES